MIHSSTKILTLVFVPLPFFIPNCMFNTRKKLCKEFLCGKALQKQQLTNSRSSTRNSTIALFWSLPLFKHTYENFDIRSENYNRNAKKKKKKKSNGKNPNDNNTSKFKKLPTFIISFT